MDETSTPRRHFLEELCVTTETRGRLYLLRGVPRAHWALGQACKVLAGAGGGGRRIASPEDRWAWPAGLLEALTPTC